MHRCKSALLRGQVALQSQGQRTFTLRSVASFRSVVSWSAASDIHCRMVCRKLLQLIPTFLATDAARSQSFLPPSKTELSSAARVRCMAVSCLRADE